MSDTPDTVDRDRPSEPPTHIAIIMDGNGRWAAQRGLPRKVGHQRGVEAVRRTVEAAAEIGLRYLTLYGFSTENWKRPQEEVGDLLGLLRRFIRRDLVELHQNGIRVRVIGERSNLASDLVQLIEEAENLTQTNTRLQLLIAFNYGGQSEIAAAARRIAFAVRDGRINPEDVTVETFGDWLDTAEVPDPELIIRTSGEKRLSNFLLWQSAYAELVFPEIFWPDFGRDALEQAIAEYHARDRRFGGRPNEVSA